MFLLFTNIANVHNHVCILFTEYTEFLGQNVTLLISPHHFYDTLIL